MFDEYRKVGAVEIAQPVEGLPYLRVRNQKLLEDTAFAMAVQVRLWQRGIPLNTQREWFGKIDFDRSNPDQAEDITAEADRRLSDMRQSQSDTLEHWKKLVDSESLAYYSLERMREIKSVLDPILARLDKTQPLILMAGDERIDSMVAIH